MSDSTGTAISKGSIFQLKYMNFDLTASLSHQKKTFSISGKNNLFIRFLSFSFQWCLILWAVFFPRHRCWNAVFNWSLGLLYLSDLYLTRIIPLTFIIIFQGSPGPYGDSIIHVFSGRGNRVIQRKPTNMQTPHRKAPTCLGIEPGYIQSRMLPSVQNLQSVSTLIMLHITPHHKRSQKFNS